MRELSRWLDRLTALKAAGIGLLLAALIELVTVVLRFGFDLQSTRDTAWLAHCTFGIRIHHGYLGAPLLLAAFSCRGWKRNGLLALGIALLASDLVHHFVVLKAVVGNPQFDLVYPGWPPD